MGVFSQIPGLPGYVSEKIAKHRPIAADGYLEFLPGGVTLDGSKTRDAGNPDYNATTDPLAMFRLRAGLLLGKVTSSGKYTNSFLGYTNGALTSAGTTVTLASANHGVEMVRRIGAAGTFKLVGPPTASGTVRALTATYSAISSTSVTITALGVNEVQTVAFPIASTGGSIALELYDPRNSNYVKVEAASWSATDATYLSNIQAKLDLAFGAANIVVVSAQAATDTDSALVFTYSGTGVAATPVVDGSGTAKLPIVTTLPTSSTSYTVARTTAGVDGRFVTGSLIADTDGSDVPLTFVPDGWERLLPTDGTDSFAPRVPVAGNVDMSQFLPYWPADASLKQYIRDKLNTFGKFVDTSKY